MNPEAQRIAIAEACGWYRIAQDEDQNTWAPHGWVYGKHAYGKLRSTATLPDYLSDLNAMHEAEKTLSEQQWFRYHQEILVQTGSNNFGTAFEWRDRFKILHATAVQRAEAFLRTIGKWTEKGTK